MDATSAIVRDQSINQSISKKYMEALVWGYCSQCECRSECFKALLSNYTKDYNCFCVVSLSTFLYLRIKWRSDQISWTINAENQVIPKASNIYDKGASLILPPHLRHWWCRHHHTYQGSWPAWYASCLSQHMWAHDSLRLFQAKSQPHQEGCTDGRNMKSGPSVQSKVQEGSCAEDSLCSATGRQWQKVSWKGSDVIGPPSSTLAVLWNLIWSVSRGKNCLLVPCWRTHQSQAVHLSRRVYVTIDYSAEQIALSVCFI